MTIAGAFLLGGLLGISLGWFGAFGLIQYWLGRKK